MATIMTPHIEMNIAAAAGHACPGMRIHIIDIVHPPGISIPPDISAQNHAVAATLTAKAATDQVYRRNSSRVSGARCTASSIRAGSVLVEIVMLHPRLRPRSFLIPPLREEIEKVICRIDHLDPAGVGGVGVIDRTVVVLVEDADPFAVEHLHRQLCVI